MLSPLTKRKIAEFAEVFREYFDLPFPIRESDLERVVGDMGGRIEIVPGTYNTNIVKTGDDSFILQLPAYICTSKERQSFALAQAIGLLFFSKGYMVDDAKWKSIPVEE